MLNESTPPGLPDSRLGTEPTQPQLQSAAATFALLGSAPRLHLAWLMAHETSDVGTLARIKSGEIAVFPAIRRLVEGRHHRRVGAH